MTDEAPRPVVVVDLRMPFVSMVIFMFKWALASIPALLLLALFASMAATLFGGLASGVFWHTFGGH